MSFDDYDERYNEPEYEVEENDGSWTEEEVEIALVKAVDTVNEKTSEVETKPSVDPFEKKKQELRDNQKTTYENPDKKYVEIEIPATGKVGDEFKIKVSKEVPIIEFAVCQKIEWKKKDKFDRSGKKELVGKPFMIGEQKNTDTCTFKWEDNYIFQGKTLNGLKAGEYLVEVSARSKKAYEETKALRLVKVE